MYYMKLIINMWILHQLKALTTGPFMTLYYNYLWWKGGMSYCSGFTPVYPTFVIPGLFGYGADDTLSKIIPYMDLGPCVDTLQVGPVSSIGERMTRVQHSLRQRYPQLSPEHPIDLVGHSLGATTILALLAADPVIARSVRRVVLVEGVLGGYHHNSKLMQRDTHTLHRWVWYTFNAYIWIFHYVIETFSTDASTRILPGIDGTFLTDSEPAMCRKICEQGLRAAHAAGVEVRILSTNLTTDTVGGYYLPI